MVKYFKRGGNVKSVLITGASSGIGRQFALTYGKKGYRLILAARNKEKLTEVAEETGAECRLISVDLSRESECFRLLEEVKDEDIDIFINNAGYGLAGSFLETDLKEEIGMIDVNDKAMHILCKEVLKKMVSKDQGTILNVASSAGLLPGGPYMAGYYASKAYVTSLTRAIARELKERNSRVKIAALCPGPVDTGFNKRAKVVFALKGISPQKCVDECLKEMAKGKTIIVPTFKMKAAVFAQRFLPAGVMVALTGRQQKRKLG